MKLQVIYGNPSPKKGKKARKAAKKLLTRKKTAKIGTVGRKTVAKKIKKGSAAAKAWGKKMKKLREAKLGKKKKKAKHNPKRGRKNATGYIQRPVYRKTKFRYPDAEDVIRNEHMAKEFENFYQADMRKAEKEYSSPFDVFMRGKKEARHLAALNREAVKAAKAAERAKKRRKAGQQKLEEAKAEGAKVTITKGNPMAKRRKRRKHKVKSNPKKKRSKRKSVKKVAKKATKRKSRRRRKAGGASARVFKTAKTFKFRRAKKKVRVKMVGIVNPAINMDTVKALAVPAMWAAGGVLAINYVLIPLIDKNLGASIPGGSIAGAVAKIPVVGEYLAPVSGTLAGLGVGLGVAYAAKKFGKGSQAAQMVSHAAIGAVGLSAALIALDFGTRYVLPQVKSAVGLSGVRFFPGHAMGSPDFGMYPQMGDGYRQSPADFGLIPQGLRGIPQGMRGVEFFPKKSGMGAVEFYPDGSDGEDMYRQSEASDLMEAEGLGIVPEGLHGADFGSPDFGGEGQLG